MKKFAFIDVQNTETKLRNLTKESGAPVRFVELDNLKFRINNVI